MLIIAKILCLEQGAQMSRLAGIELVKTLSYPFVVLLEAVFSLDTGWELPWIVELAEKQASWFRSENLRKPLQFI